MMRQYGQLLLIVIILVCCQILDVAPSMGGAPAADEEVVGQFMTLSGLDQQVQRLPQSYLGLVEEVFSGLEKRSCQIPMRVKQRIRSSFTDALNPDVLDRAIRQQLADRLPPETTDTALTWLHTELGQKATQAEVRAINPDTPLALTEFALQLRVEPPSPQRIQLVRRLEEVTQGNALATASWERIVRVMGNALETTLLTNKPEAQKIFRNGMASIKENLQPFFRQGRLLELLFTYRSLTEGELTSYVEFLESPPGRTLTRSVNDIVQGAAAQAVTNMESSLIHSLQTEDPQKA